MSVPGHRLFPFYSKFRMLKDYLGKRGYDDDLLTVYHAFQEAIQQEIWKQCIRRLPQVSEAARAEVRKEIEKKVRETFRWQKFLSKGILQKHAQKYVDASARSKSDIWAQGSSAGLLLNGDNIAL